MRTALKPLPVRDATAGLAAIAAIDLDPIKYKMMDPEEGMGWSRNKADAIEIQYRRFLELKLLYMGTTITPTRDIDAMWHYHILDTSKYMVDCERIFGNYLHHFPYLGMRGEADKKDLLACFEKTKRLYRERFSEEMTSENGLVATSNCKSYCGGNVQLLADEPRPTLPSR